MLVRVSTELEAPAERVWPLLKRTETLRYVTRGLLGIDALGGGVLPAAWRPGEELCVRLRPLHVLPGWLHCITTVAVDDERREALTNERGGPIKAWRHRLVVEPLPGGRSRYTDEIAIDAGRLTPVVGAFAHLFFRYRQARWRGLARVLG